MSNKIQQIYSLFISINCSTCFGWYLHPSSGAHINSLMRPLLLPIVNVTSRSRQVAVTVSLMPDTVETVIWAPDDGWRYHPKHVEQFTDKNKLYIGCNLLENYWHILHDARTTEHKKVLIQVTDGSRTVLKKKYSVDFQLEMDVFLQN